MKRRFSFVSVIVVLAVLSIFVAAIFASEANARIEISGEEAAWLKAHPVLRHAPDNDYAPFEFKDENNRIIGVTPDILQINTDEKTGGAVRSDSRSQLGGHTG